MLQKGLLQLIPPDTTLAQALAEYYQRNREFLREFEPEREDAFFTPEHQKTILEQEILSAEQKRGYRFYICLSNEPSRIIGSIGLSNVVWGAFRSAHLGYKLDQVYINRGYMSIAVSLVTEYAFRELELHRIEANVMPKNIRSLRVLEKNGYENEGLSKYYLKINGIWEDHIHMVKLNTALHETT